MQVYITNVHVFLFYFCSSLAHDKMFNSFNKHIEFSGNAKKHFLCVFSQSSSSRIAKLECVGAANGFSSVSHFEIFDSGEPS